MNFEIKHLLPAKFYEQYMFCRELSTTVKTATDMLNIVQLIETHSEYKTEFDWFRDNISEIFDIDVMLITNLKKVDNDVLFICTILIPENGKVITDEQGNEIVNTVLNYFLNKKGE
jgi:hypothetical protein